MWGRELYFGTRTWRTGKALERGWIPLLLSSGACPVYLSLQDEEKLRGGFCRLAGIAAAIAFVLAWRLARELRHR